MAYSRPSSYPYPRNLVDHKGELSPIGVKEHLEQLYKSMLENDSRGEYAKDKDTDIDLKELFVRPEWYGAKGDGVTDDTAAFNAAVSGIRPEGAITDQAGGVVQLGAKRYVIKGEIVGKPGVVFKGCGGMQYNDNLGTNLARKVTWIDHQPTSANTDCFVFDTNAWDTYGRASGCGVRDLYVSGTTNSRRMISYPGGVIKPVVENIQTGGGSVGLYFVYAIESSFRYSTFAGARDYGIYIGYTDDPTHSTSTDISFFGCNVWGQDITGTGLYADWAITTNWFGGAIYECTDHLAHVGVDKGVEINFYGTHFETGSEQAGFIIKTGDVAAAKSVVRLFGARVQYTYATLTNTYAIVSNYASVLVFSGSLLGAGYAFDCTANTDNVFIGEGCQWGGAFGSVIPATDDVSMMPKVIGFSYTGTATSNANSLYRANSYATTVQTAAYAASFIPRPQLGGVIKVSLTGNMTVNGPNSDYGGSPDMAVIGHTMLFDLTADATPRVVTWWTPYTTQWAGGAQTIPASGRQLVRFYYDGAKWIQDGVVLDQAIATSDGPTFDHLTITNHVDADSITTTGTGGSYDTGIEVRSGANMLFRPTANDFDWKIRAVDYGIHVFQGLDNTNPVLSMTHLGKVGINDSAPAEKLDVDGNINTTGVVKVDDVQVLGSQALTQAALKADYTTGDLDTEAEIIAAINATNAGFNALLAKIKVHGLLASA